MESEKYCYTLDVLAEYAGIEAVLSDSLKKESTIKEKEIEKFTQTNKALWLF